MRSKNRDKHVLSTHTITVVLVGEITIKLESAILTKYADGRMMDAIEHIGLDRCVVNHILEDKLFTNPQWMIKGPVAHEVATEAAVTSDSVGIWQLPRVRRFVCDSTTDLRMIWHLEAIRHMAGEADVDNGRLDAFVLHDVHNVGHEESRLPCEC